MTIEAGTGEPRAAFHELLDAVDRLLRAPETEDGARPYRDVIADLLGYLARRVTSLHERRVDEVRSFLDWLEARLGCEIDELSGKTFVRAYYAQEEGVEKLLEVIEKNHPSSTELDVSEPEDYGTTNPDRERIVRGFQKSINRLRPIHREIELTDELIDRIVYRLYDLDEEEIELVEASVPARDPYA